MQQVSFLDAVQYRYKPPESSYLIHFVVKTNSRFDAEKLERSIQRVVKEIPILSSRYVCEDGVPKFWEQLSKLPQLVRVSKESSEVIVKTPCDLEGLPPIRITIARGRDSDDLVVSLDHVAGDAHGLCFLMEVLSETYQRLDDPNFSLKIPKQPDDRGFDFIFEKFSDEELRSAVQKAEEVVPKLLLWQNPFRDYLTEDTDITSVRRSLEPEEFVRVKAFGKRCGGTVNDLLIAAYGVALFEIGARGLLPIESVIDMRRYFPEEAKFWLRNFGIVYWSSVGVLGSESFSEIVQKVGRESEEFKKFLPGVGDVVYYMDPKERKRRGVSLLKEDPAYHPKPLFLSNVGVIPESSVQFGEDVLVTDVYLCANFLSDEYPAVVACTWKNRLSLFASGTYGAKLIEEVIERMIEVLREAA